MCPADMMFRDNLNRDIMSRDCHVSYGYDVQGQFKQGHNEQGLYDPAEEYYSLNNYFTENIIQRYSNTVVNLWYRARIARLLKTTLFTPLIVDLNSFLPLLLN